MTGSLMNWEDEHFLIENHLDDNWIDTPYTVENTAFTPPPGPWVKLIVLSGESKAISLGPNIRTRNSGTICVQIFTQQNTGVSEARKLADRVAQIFQNESFNGITCRAASMEYIGERGGRYQLNVNVPFYRDD